MVGDIELGTASHPEGGTTNSGPEGPKTVAEKSNKLFRGAAFGLSVLLSKPKLLLKMFLNFPAPYRLNLQT